MMDIDQNDGGSDAIELPRTQDLVQKPNGWEGMKSMLRRVSIAAQMRHTVETTLRLDPLDPMVLMQETMMPSRPWSRPQGAAAAAGQATLQAAWTARFPRGRQVVATPGTGSLCAMFAVLISMRAQFPDVRPQPTLETLRDLDGSDPQQAQIARELDRLPHGGGASNFSIDHAAAIFTAWGRRNGLVCVLCVEIRSTDGNPQAIFFQGSTADNASPATLYLWIHHNNNGHYSGMVALDAQGRPVQDLERLLRRLNRHRSI